ncbi:unnamed protein product [Adineta steineri]|uniref:F-box domain-containing protein n=1 Tax=Adineta steineri TaxID=433720 RepID=A0A819EE39_9BILA|nr:unnamed protein product [Adineta steineri]CAF3848223.1 unnamed protein product [Adineta steineri]
MITKFEQLPNELILNCFIYFNFYELYQSFFGLNQRINKLMLYQTDIIIDLDLIPNGDLLTFYYKLNHFLSLRKNHPLSMNTSNEQRFTLIMNDNLFQDKFSKLKSLTLFDIHAGVICDAIFDKRIKLYKTLEKLILQEISEAEEHGQDIERLCSQLISSKMKSLKYLNINVKSYSCGCEIGIQSRDSNVDLEFLYLSDKEKSFSNLETLIIGDIHLEDTTKVSFHTLTEKLLPHLPKLQNLMINSIHFNENKFQLTHGTHQSTIKTNATIPINLKLIKICTHVETNNEHMEEENKQLLKNFFLNNNSSDIKTFYINDENVLE